MKFSFEKPQLIPTLFIIAATTLLSGLGIWQVQRLAWKNAMIAQIENGQHMQAQEWRTVPKEPVMYSRVQLKGEFLHDRQAYLVAQPRNNQQGFNVVTPFKLSSGEVVLVGRGWTVRDKQTLPKDAITVEGVLRPERGKNPLYSSILPQNQPEKNLWFYEDPAAMARGIEKARTDFIIEQVGSAQEGVFPQPSNGRISIRNDHLGYAITWFTLAFAGIIMFAIYHRKKD